jgi:hypothetical protein
MKKTSFVKALAIAAPMILGAAPAFASAIVSGFNTTWLGACDDCSYGSAVSPGFNMNFYGATYSSFYVNNNGNITFNSPLSAYTPYGVGAGYSGQPIIAPFFADADTRDPASGVTAFGTGTYNGRNAVGVTWSGVGYFFANADKLDTFQLILTDRSDVNAGDFDIYFNYGGIQWESGDMSGGGAGLGGTSAAVGYSNGTGAPGTYFQLEGSLVPGSFLDGGPNALASGSNDGMTGQYLFRVRNGAITAPGAVPEPGAWALMILGFGAAGAMLRRHRSDVAA